MATSSLPLEGLFILVVEDDYLIAGDLETGLKNVGAIVVGPVASPDDAQAILEATAHIDFALLDANLGGEDVFPFADTLISRKMAFIFTTGYGSRGIPARFRRITRLEKPVEISEIVCAIKAMHQA